MAKAKPLTLSFEDHSRLETITKTRTLQAQTVTRARILLLKADGESIDSIAEKVGLNRNSVLLCLKKYNQGGIENAIYDAPGRGRNAEITDDEKTWIINIACQRPGEFGYSAETWTYAKLTEHINKTAESAGFTRLSTLTKTSIKTFWMQLKLNHFVSSIIAKSVIQTLKQKCMRFFSFISRLKCCLMTMVSYLYLQQSMMYTLTHMMKNQAFRLFLLLEEISIQPQTMEPLSGIMNINVWVRFPC